jgi:hypothetical protein
VTLPASDPVVAVPEDVDRAAFGAQPGKMSVLPFPSRAHWAWDARGHDRAVRVSPHPQENVVNLSVWREDVCVGTVRLRPADVAVLIAGLADGLADLAQGPANSTVVELPVPPRAHS